MKLIDKDALVAEIEKLVDKGKYHEEFDCAYRDGNNDALYALKDKLDTLEAREVDFDEEFSKYHIGMYNPFNSGADIYEFAKHFFELGLKESNPLTWQDVKLLSEIGEDFMNSRESNSFSEEEYYQEILRRFKAQKGE